MPGHIPIRNFLIADGIQLSFGLKKVLSDVCLELYSGDIRGLIGPNGAGKTSLMQIIFGSQETPESSIRINGEVYNKLIRSQGAINYLPQSNFIPPNFRMTEIFYDYNLSEEQFKEHFPQITWSPEDKVAKLSSGERRILEVYIITQSDAQFSLLDEPFSFIAPVYVETLIDLIRKQSVNKGFLVSDHAHRYIRQICHGYYVLDDGILGSYIQIAKIGIEDPST